MTKKKCRTCRKTFRVEITPSGHSGRGKFCSVACRSESKSGTSYVLSRAQIREAIRRYRSGESSVVIARDLGCTQSTISYQLKNSGVQMRKFTPNAPLRMDLPMTEIIRLYESGFSTTALGAKFGCSDATIANRLRKAGVDLRGARLGNGHHIRCKDGHVVRSHLERMVCDWLYQNDIAHAYETALPFDPKRSTDFFARGIYIEIWGVEKSSRYAPGKQRKIAAYRDAGLRLISLDPDVVAHGLDAALRECLANPPR